MEGRKGERLTFPFVLDTSEDASYKKCKDDGGVVVKDEILGFVCPIWCDEEEISMCITRNSDTFTDKLGENWNWEGGLQISPYTWVVRQSSKVSVSDRKKDF